MTSLALPSFTRERIIAGIRYGEVSGPVIHRGIVVGHLRAQNVLANSRQDLLYQNRTAAMVHLDHTFGASCESVVADDWGIPWGLDHRAVNPTPGGADLEAWGEVKGRLQSINRRWTFYQMMVRAKPDPDLIYILVIAHPPFYGRIGWLYGSEVRQFSYDRKFQARLVSWHELRPYDTLSSIVEGRRT